MTNAAQDDIAHQCSTPSSNHQASQTGEIIDFPGNTLVRVDRSINLKMFFGNGWRISHADSESLRIGSFELEKLLRPTVTADDEQSLELRERIRRMDVRGFVPLDAHAFVAMWEKRALFPEAWKDDIRGHWSFHFIAGSRFYDHRNVQHLLHFRFRVNEWEYEFRPAERDLYPSSTMLALARETLVN